MTWTGLEAFAGRNKITQAIIRATAVASRLRFDTVEILATITSIRQLGLGTYWRW